MFSIMSFLLKRLEIKFHNFLDNIYFFRYKKLVIIFLTIIEKSKIESFALDDNDMSWAFELFVIA